MMVWAILFWLAVLSIIHSYLLFPLVLIIISGYRKKNGKVYTEEDDLPFVSVLMAVHNEEVVLIRKLRSVFSSVYPEDRFEMLVGSDCSTDRTNEILKIYANDCPSLKYFVYEERQGKPSILNRLREEAAGSILVMTDANVMFGRDTLFELVRHFSDERTGVVAGNIIYTRTSPSGISIPEWNFLARETRIKTIEGRVWGCTIGAEGGCYAIRTGLYSPVPKGFAVDDFYISMKILEKGYRSLLEPKAVAYEDVADKLGEAFRRKVRISSGNFMNLKVFRKLLWPPFTGLFFCFFSHKVLRWFGPFALLVILATNIILAPRHEIYMATLMAQLGILAILIIDYLLRKIRFHIVFLRFITHFYSMNLALLLGFFKFLQRERTDVWEPTKRAGNS